MSDPVVNAYKAEITGLPYADTHTSISVNHVTDLPDPATDGEFNLVIWNRAHGSPGDAKNEGEFEIVRVTGITGTTLTVTRGQEGTTAIALGASGNWMTVNAVTKKTLGDKADLSGATIQTIIAQKTNVYAETVSASATYTADIPGLIVNFTPKYASSKIIVTVDLGYGGSGAVSGISIFRNGVAIGIGDAASLRTRLGRSINDGSTRNKHITVEAEDSPGVTTQVTYSVRLQSTSAGETFYVNRGSDDGDSAIRYRTASTIKVQEVAA